MGEVEQGCGYLREVGMNLVDYRPCLRENALQIRFGRIRLL